MMLTWILRPDRYIDYAWPLFAVYGVLALLRSDRRSALFFCGVLVGLAGFVGRNHGLYIGTASVAALGLRYLLYRKPMTIHVVGWSAGVLAGYAPMLVMVLFVPEFAEALWTNLSGLFERGGADLARTLPWPSGNPFAGQESIRQMLSAILFVALPATYVTGIVVSIRNRSDRGGRAVVLLSASIVGLAYLHYAYKRADLIHLSLAILPWVVSLILLAHNVGPIFRRRLLLGLGLFLTVACALPAHHSIHKALRVDTYVPFETGSERLELREPKARALSALRDTVNHHVGSEEPLLVAPYWPVLYPILDRESPVYDTYLLFPPTPEMSRRLVEELRASRTRWALVADDAIDGLPSRAFRNTHPQLWAHINTNFCRRVVIPGEPVWLLMRACAGDEAQGPSSVESTPDRP
jgi:hypothetical protein